MPRRRKYLLLAFLALATPASAQYAYPPGYAGWGGWGGATTAAGSTARGMGAFAAGAGAYNEQTAQARSINAQTAMQFNNYLWQNQQVRNQQYYAQLAEKQQRVNETAATTYSRLHDHPEAADVKRGDALNVVLDELTQPSVYSQTSAAANVPLSGETVRNIAFQYAPGAITISLENLSANGVPDVLLTNPAFEADRQAIRPLVAKVRQEAQANEAVDPQTLALLRAAIKKAETTVAAKLPLGTPDRDQADNWLKAFYGLTKMLQKPAIENYLKELKADQTTSLGQLLAFMQAFNLRFGAAQTPDQEAAAVQLYPKLVALRDQVNAPAINPVTAPVSPPPAKHAMTFFSGMDMSHVNADGSQAISVPSR